MASIGFVYWIFAARLYSPLQIGLATTFLSAASLINGFSMLGFGNTIIRYLPNSEVKEKKINTTFTVVSIAALILGIIYLLGLPLWTEKLMFVRTSIPLLLVAILFFPTNTLNNITDSVFTAFRETQWVFVSNMTQSTVKLISLIFLTSFGAWGVIGSNVVATFVAVALCLLIITNRYSIHYYPTFDKVILSRIKRFALGNYFYGLISGLPAMLMPIIITNRISPEQTAYFYMPNMIVNLLMIIPTSISRSYFSESSGLNKSVSMKNPMFISYVILIPAVVFLIVFGKYILNIFGRNYALQGYTYLLLVSVSTLIYVGICFLGYRLLMIEKMAFIIKVQFLSSFLYLALTFILTFMGINGVGIASLVSSIVTISIYSIDYISYKKVHQ